MTTENQILDIVKKSHEIPEGSRQYKKIIKLLNQLADENYWRGHGDGYGQCNSTHKECQGSFY